MIATEIVARLKPSRYTDLKTALEPSRYGEMQSLQPTGFVIFVLSVTS